MTAVQLSNRGTWSTDPLPSFVKGLEQKYVSRGGLKLEGALRHFGVDVKGRVVLDAGASTGGFTDCLLQHGAARVYAVDVGYGQLAGKLRNDPRVVNMERTNISDTRLQELTPKPSLATLDLSYLSLRKAVPIVSKLLTDQGELNCLVKPLFEVADPQARRTGIIPELSMYEEILADLAAAINRMGLTVLGAAPSQVTGSKGTLEFWLRISKLTKPKPALSCIMAQIKQAVLAAAQLHTPGQ